MPLLALLEKPEIRTHPDANFRTKPKLRHMEVVFASILLLANDIRGPLETALNISRARGNDTQEHHILSALKTLIFEHIPMLFLIGQLVRECTWSGRENGTGVHALHALQYSFLLMLCLTGSSAHKVEYVRSMALALLSWTPWHTNLPGVTFNEETCEAMLSRLAALVVRYPTATDASSLMDLFLTIRPVSMSYKDIKKTNIPKKFPGELYHQIIVLINTCNQSGTPFTR